MRPWPGQFQRSEESHAIKWRAVIGWPGEQQRSGVRAALDGRETEIGCGYSKVQVARIGLYDGDGGQRRLRRWIPQQLGHALV